jgi:hypothetical protein
MTPGGIFIMSNISIESRLLTWLGSVFIGKPSALGVPENFYWVPGERRVDEIAYDNPIVVRKLIEVDAFRRRLFVKVGYVSAALAAAICVAGVFVLHGLNAVTSEVRVAAQQDANRERWCAQMRGMDATNFTPQLRDQIAAQCH